MRTTGKLYASSVCGMHLVSVWSMTGFLARRDANNLIVMIPILIQTCESKKQ